MKRFLTPPFELDTTKELRKGEHLYYQNAWLVICQDGVTRRLLN